MAKQAGEVEEVKVKAEVQAKQVIALRFLRFIH